MENLLLEMGMNPADAQQFSDEFGSNIQEFYMAMDPLLCGERPILNDEIFMADAKEESWMILSSCYFFTKWWREPDDVTWASFGDSNGLAKLRMFLSLACRDESEAERAESARGDGVGRIESSRYFIMDRDLECFLRHLGVTLLESQELLYCLYVRTKRDLISMKNSFATSSGAYSPSGTLLPLINFARIPMRVQHKIAYAVSSLSEELDGFVFQDGAPFSFIILEFRDARKFCVELGLDNEEMQRVFFGMLCFPLPYNYLALRRSVLDCLDETVDFYSPRNMRCRHRIECAVIFLARRINVFGKQLTYRCLPPGDPEPYPNPYFVFGGFCVEVFEAWLQENNLTDLETADPLLPLAGQLDTSREQPRRENRRQRRMVSAAPR